jgi:hypothetical protein
MLHLCAQLAEDSLAPYLAKIGDRALRHALEYGVAFLHETQPPAERDTVALLFKSGAIQARLSRCARCAAHAALRTLRPAYLLDVACCGLRMLWLAVCRACCGPAVGCACCGSPPCSADLSCVKRVLDAVTGSSGDSFHRTCTPARQCMSQDHDP